MENNDTPVVEETTPVTEEVAPVTEEVTTVVEETTTPEDKIGEEEITLDELLSALIPTNDEKETIPDGPVFDDTKKEDDSITEQELEELENEVGTIIDELETEVATANTKIEELNSKISDEQKNNEEIATALKKIVDHPSLGKFAQDILEGKEVDIPKILEDKVNEDIASMADISTQAPVSIEPKKVSLGQRLGSMRTL